MNEARRCFDGLASVESNLKWDALRDFGTIFAI